MSTNLSPIMPVGGGSGIVSLLAAVKPDTLGMTRGAGLSGTLKSVTYVRFEQDDEGENSRVRVSLGSKGRPAKVRKGVLYS